MLHSLQCMYGWQREVGFVSPLYSQQDMYVCMYTVNGIYLFNSENDMLPQ